MKKRIIAAEQNDNGIDEILSDLKDDFTYISDGIEKMNRMGGDSAKNALSIAVNFRDTLQTVISEIANEISK